MEHPAPTQNADKSPAWRNGYHCGFLISKPQCPYSGADAEDWESGFTAGRKQLHADHQRWLQERKQNNGTH